MQQEEIVWQTKEAYSLYLPPGAEPTPINWHRLSSVLLTQASSVEDELEY